MAEGRRERMRNKIRSRGVDGLPPHEVVEFLLYPFVPRKDTSPLAKTLLAEFGGLDRLFDASEDQLLSIPGMPKMAALTFPQYKRLISKAEMTSIKNRIKDVKDPMQLGKYCVKLLENCVNERVVAIYLDANQRIIEQKIISDGNNTSSKVDFVTISKGAILYNAKYVVITHNHPNGSLIASTDDNIITQNLKRHLEQLGVILLEHVIVSGPDFINIIRSVEIEED